jgi:hypothetical protein
MTTANNSDLEYEIDRWTPLRESFFSDYSDITDEDDFHPDDLKELHDDIIKVTVEKTWLEHRNYIDEVCITFYLTNDEKIEIDLERDKDGTFYEKGWF